jgi:hypothetical protein
MIVFHLQEDNGRIQLDETGGEQTSASWENSTLLLLELCTLGKNCSKSWKCRPCYMMSMKGNHCCGIQEFFPCMAYEWQTPTITVGTKDRWQWCKFMEGISFLVTTDRLGEHSTGKFEGSILEIWCLTAHSPARGICVWQGQHNYMNISRWLRKSTSAYKCSALVVLGNWKSSMLSNNARSFGASCWNGERNMNRLLIGRKASEDVW